MTRERQGKGAFGEAGMPIAPGYLFPGRRVWTWLAGLVGCGAVAVWFLGAFVFSGKRAIAPGPLSASHATFEGDCAACHTRAIGLGPVPSDGCLACHERIASDRGAYGFAAHYVYASGDRSRTADADRRSRETPCAGCHSEHGGRTASIAAVADRRCVTCHGFGSFGSGHPEFAFARGDGDGEEGAADEESSLTFPHRFHVREVRRVPGFDDPQLACLYCHRPEASGAGFAPIEFEASCGDCHLTSRTATPLLPIQGGGEPGVETLAMIQARGGPGTRWAYFTNPDEYEVRGGSVRKRPVYHADPWVMANLAEIRRALHPGRGLAELLRTAVVEKQGGTGGAPAAAELYREAITSLRARALELRGRPEPEVQAELAEIEVLLAAAERRLAAGEPAPVGPFAAAPGLDPALSADQVTAYRQLALDLTEPCRKCHVVSDAAILRARKDLRTLRRARFDHRAHVVQVPRCTDCHGAIPGLAEVTAKSELPDEPADVAATRNLPRIAVCRECHNRAQASDACATCHLFHPESGRRADLLVHPPPAARSEAAATAAGGGA